MGSADPPAVQDARGDRHVIQEFDVPLVLDDGTTVSIAGEVVWVPGPSPWPWLGLGAALALVLIAVAFTRWWPAALGVGLALLIAAEGLHLVGLWGATTASPVTKLLAGVYSEVALILAVGAFVLLLRRGATEAAPAVVVAALFVTIAGGLADVTALFRSQVPTTLPENLTRVAIAVALGAGIGTTVAAGLHLRRSHLRTTPSASARAGAARVPPSVPETPVS